MAEYLNLSDDGLCRLVSEGMPRYAHGLYDLGPCIQRYIEYRTKSASTSCDVAPPDLYVEELHQLQAVVVRALTGIDRGLAEDLSCLGDPVEITDRLQLASGRIRTAISDGLDRYVATIKE